MTRFHRIGLLLVGMLSAATPTRSVEPDRRWEAVRHRMVEQEVYAAGITDARVCSAMRDTPRHLFVPATQRAKAYFDMALPIGGGQTISPPFIVAFMTQQLDPQPTDKVLEIGTGSGYQAAVLSPLVDQVYSIEIVESLARRSARTLARLGYENVHTKLGDGFQGWAEHAPFDKIVVTCSPEDIPPTLVEQLREGGSLVIPLGERYQQVLYRLTKAGQELKQEALQPTFFVPMTGRAEQLRTESEDAIPRLVNGNFESSTDEGLPMGWYYVRQAVVQKDKSAHAGAGYLKFSNQTPGRGSQALQAVGMDGRRVREIQISLWARTTDVRSGQMAHQLPHVELSYYDKRRALAGSSRLGPWQGTRNWSRQKVTVRVPSKARLAVIAVGLFGAVGQLDVDRLELEVVQLREH